MWSSVDWARDSGVFPCGRGKHAAALLGGGVYVLGGRGAGGSLPLKDFWKYNIEEGTWLRVVSRGDGPPCLQEHTMVAHGHCLYVFGGEAGANNTETPLWCYNTQSGMWRKLCGSQGAAAVRRRGKQCSVTPSPRGRRGHSAHCLDECMLLYGGYKDMCGSTNELWAFHYKSEQWHELECAPAGPPRHGHAAVMHKQRLYLHGGCHDLRPCADLWCLDTLSRSWSQVRCSSRACPSPRSGHVAVKAGGWMYIFGGAVRGQPDNEMWRYHFASETWERMMTPSTVGPSARTDATALLVGECVPLSAAESPVSRGGGGGGGGRGMSGVARHLSFGRRARYSALPGEESPALNKSRSAYQVEEEQPMEGDEAEYQCELSREPLSVPDFGARPLLPVPDTLGTKGEESDTSAYESTEAVSRLSQGFCNPHYLGGMTPDSGLGAAEIEMRVLRSPARGKLHIMLLGGKELPHTALITAPSAISMWTYRLL